VRLLYYLVQIPASDYYSWQRVQRSRKLGSAGLRTESAKVLGVHDCCYDTHQLRAELGSEGCHMGRLSGYAPRCAVGACVSQLNAFAPHTTELTHWLRCAPNWLLNQPKPTQVNRD
jgi:putative transposase